MERLNRIGTELMTVAATHNVQREDGQTMAEYALILTGIALIAMVGAALLGGQLSTVFTNISTQLGG